MKKIINNKVYDTATAERVGGWSNGCYTNDFQYCSEGLYRKRTGEFFLHGEGGAMSKYAKSSGNNNWGYGEKIIPLTYQAAKEWAEKHLGGEEYEAIFGEVVEDDSKVMLAIYVQSSKAEQYKRAAAQAGMSLTAYLESLLDKASEL